MLTNRYQPYSELFSGLEQVRNRMDQMFGRQPSEYWVNYPNVFPAMNIWQDQECVYAEAELPGMQLDDLEIYVTGGNQLSLKGERKQPQVDKGVWHRQERNYGPFSRLITLPVPVDADKIEAKFCHGVLTVQMPKSETAKPRKIAVKAG